jgi:hypothetical protein
MITLNGSIKRTFYFPAEPQLTLEYLGNLSRVVRFLPHIEVVEVFSESELRVQYRSVELGTYTINIYCDICSHCDVQGNALLIQPSATAEPISPAVTLNSTTGYGFYTSHSLFRPVHGGTEIDYSLTFQARIPRPRGLRMMPGAVVNRIAKSISDGRVLEMADGFMQNAATAFPNWLAGQNGSAP